MKTLTFASALVAATLFAQSKIDKPETVMVTYHARPGSEDELARVLARQWTTARELNLVLATPHVMVRGTEEGTKTYFVEVLTWRDESIPDAAPAPIQALWSEMNKLVERRNGRPGIDFTEVAVVAK
jgi:hypothetical protein